MIIKSMSRKSGGFRQLLDYLDRDSDSEGLTWNLLSSERKDIAQEFMGNSRYAQKRKNGVLLYHEILSFSPKDKGVLTPAILEDLTFSYLEKRAVGALAYAQIHSHQSAPHVHLVISANLLKQAKKLHLNKAQFQEIKLDLEAYQREKYPQLKHSIAFEKDSGRALQKSNPEIERDRRINFELAQAEPCDMINFGKGRAEPSKKERVRKKLQAILHDSTGEEEFASWLKNVGYELYVRGKTIGILDQVSGKKYRLKRLGLLEDFKQSVAQWEHNKERELELEFLDKAKDFDRDLAYEIPFHEMNLFK